MRTAILGILAILSSVAEAQSASCYWADQLFTCVPPSNGQADTDVFVARAVTGPASAFPTAISPDDISDYNAGVHDSMVNKNLEHLAGATLSVSTEVVSFGSHKVFKSRFFAPSRMFMYQFAGVSGAAIVVVGCISRTARPFETGGTECEREATKAFGN